MQQQQAFGLEEKRKEAKPLAETFFSDEYSKYSSILLRSVPIIYHVMCVPLSGIGGLSLSEVIKGMPPQGGTHYIIML